MSQNTPNPYGRHEGHAGEFQTSAVGSNPYYAQQQAAPSEPDLDAGAPVLRSSDVQRMNRKALAFLAGIVALLVIAAVWMFRSASAGSDNRPKVVEQEVSIPELPKAGDVPEPTLSGAQPDLPPLPMADAAAPAAIPMQAIQPPPPTPYPDEMALAPRQPSLMERRMGGMAGMGEGTTGPAAPAVAGMPPEAYAQAMIGMMQGNQAQAAKPARILPTSAQPITNPDTLLLRGTYIRCVMETRIVTDIAGFTSCVVTEPVYSVNGRRLLLPKGSKISGSYESDKITGPRVAVVWDRITTPTGIDVNMASPGVDNLGGAGHPGDYNAHWASRISSALFISLISDAFKYAGAKHGPVSTTVTNSGNEVIEPYESNTARTLERMASQAVDRSMSRPATVTINQGTVVNVYVAKDVDFSSVLR